MGAALVFLGKLVTELGGTTGRECDHLVRKVSVVVSLVLVSQPSQGFDHRVLHLRLASVNHVVALTNVAKVGVLGFAIGARNPALVLVGIEVKLAVAEVFSQQTELPQMVGDIFADVPDGAVGTAN